jgi:hypothetical protein
MQDLLSLRMDDRLLFRKTLETYIKFSTAWTAFKLDPTAETMEELNRRHADFGPYIPGFDLSAKLEAVIRLLSSGPWSGSQIQRGCVEVAGLILRRIHGSIQVRVWHYPEDATEILHGLPYNGPPFTLTPPV